MFETILTFWIIQPAHEPSLFVLQTIPRVECLQPIVDTADNGLAIRAHAHTIPSGLFVKDSLPAYGQIHINTHSNDTDTNDDFVDCCDSKYYNLILPRLFLQERPHTHTHRGDPRSRSQRMNAVYLWNACIDTKK